MLPDKQIKEVEDHVEQHFVDSDARLKRAAVELLDAGWQWEGIRELLSKAYNAGYDRALLETGQ